MGKAIGMLCIFTLALSAVAVAAETAKVESTAAVTAPAATAEPSTHGESTAAEVTAPEPAPAFKTDKENESYAVGADVGRTLKEGGFDVDTDVLMQGIKDGMSGGALKMTPDQMRAAMESLNQKYAAHRAEASKQIADKNLKAGEAFLAENAKQPGVVTLPSGLQYQVITEGTGPVPKVNDTVKVNYVGTLIDGTEFDSSYKRGEPAVFPVNRVIPGWTEALQLMKVGSKWKLFVPAKLAYGEQGVDVIQPNSVLIFEVELLGIETPQGAGASQPIKVTPPTEEAPAATPAPEAPATGAQAK